MIFRRREKRGIGAWLYDLAVPRKGWRRGFRYIGKRVQRLPDTPHRIAIGFAAGAVASFTPFFTLHALIAVLIAWAVRGNLIAAVFGTIVGNPITFPLIAASSLKLGNWMLGRSEGVETLDRLSFSYVTEHPIEFLESIFTPYLVGGLAPGVLCGAATYLLLRPAIAGFQSRRRTILAARAETLVKERAARAEARRLRDAGEGREDAARDPAQSPSLAGADARRLLAFARGRRLDGAPAPGPDPQTEPKTTPAV